MVDVDAYGLRCFIVLFRTDKVFAFHISNVIYVGLLRCIVIDLLEGQVVVI